MLKYFKYLAVVGLLLYCVFIVGLLLFKSDYLWDFKCYYYAVTAFNQGYNPYDTPNLRTLYGFYLYPFVYLPPALLVLEPFSWLNFQEAAGLFILIKLMMLVSLVYVWLKYFLEKRPDIWFFLFCLLAFNSSVYVDFSTGNIGIIEQFFLWWGFYFWRRQNLKSFCACILAAGFFKLLPLFFLALLLFSPARSRWVCLAGSMFIGGGLVAGSWLVNPSLFAAFMQNASHMDERGFINPSTLAFLRDLLQFPPQTALYLPLSQWILYLGLVGTVLAVSAYFLSPFIKMKCLPQKERQTIIIFLACLVYALVLPRFKDYSYSLLIPPVYYIWLKIKEMRGVVPGLIIAVVFMLPVADRDLLSLPGFEPGILLTQYHSLLIVFVSWVLYLYYLRQFYVFEGFRHSQPRKLALPKHKEVVKPIS